jgi:hypothetical protein
MKRGMFRPLMLLALTGSGAASGQSAHRSADLGRLSLSLQSVVAKVGPAVVQVQVSGYGPVPGGATGGAALLGNQRSTGSGVVVSPDGSSSPRRM